MRGQKKAVLPAHSVIAGYWQDKYIHKSGKILTKTEAESIEVLIDPYEPVCMACDMPIVSPTEKAGNVESRKGQLWDVAYTREHIERCHIVPEMLGGSPEPDNLFLLCKKCHKESPDTRNREAFFRWVYDRRQEFSFGVRKPGLLLRDIDAELLRRDMTTLKGLYESLPADKRDVFIDSLNLGEDNRKKLSERIGWHEFGSNYNSMIIVFVDHILEQFLELAIA